MNFVFLMVENIFMLLKNFLVRITVMNDEGKESRVNCGKLTPTRQLANKSAIPIWTAVFHLSCGQHCAIATHDALTKEMSQILLSCSLLCY